MAYDGACLSRLASSWVGGIFQGLEKEGVVGEDDLGLDTLLDLFLDARLVGAGAPEEVLVVNESLHLLSGINEGHDSSEDQSLVVFQEDERADILVQLFVRIQREGVGVVLLPADLELLEEDFDFAVLAHDDLALVVSDDWVFDDTEVVGRQLDHVRRRPHYLLVLLLDEVRGADRDPILQ